MDATEHLPGCDERHKPGQRCLDPSDAAREIGSVPLIRIKHGCALAFAVFIVLPVALVASCYTLTETVWRVREPGVIREVEPDGVVRVFEVNEYWGGTDDADHDYLVLFYASDKPFAEIERLYTDAMRSRGYVVDARDWVRGDGRNIQFTREGHLGDCFQLGTYPSGVITLHDYRPAELEALASDEYGYIITYWRHRDFFALRWSNGC
jgi:hypothetical protein